MAHFQSTDSAETQKIERSLLQDVCEELRIDPKSGILYARAPNNSGNIVSSQFNLDAKVGNRDGNWLWGGDRFIQSSRNAAVNSKNAYVTCDLKNGSEWKFNEQDLNSHIRIVNGHLELHSLI